MWTEEAGNSTSVLRMKTPRFRGAQSQDVQEAGPCPGLFPLIPDAWVLRQPPYLPSVSQVPTIMLKSTSVLMEVHLSRVSPMWDTDV
jgi:hypothetical protein